MLGDAADELHVERDHVPFLRQGAHGDFLAQQPAAGIFDDGKRLRQNVVELLREFILVLNFGKLLLPRGGFGAQFVVGKFLKAALNLVDLRDERLESFHFAVVPRPENHFNKPSHDNSRKLASATLRERAQSVKTNRQRNLRVVQKILAVRSWPALERSVPDWF